MLHVLCERCLAGLLKVCVCVCVRVRFGRCFHTSEGGAINVANGAHVTVRNCNFTLNVVPPASTFATGGAISVRSATLIAQQCTFFKNEAARGGAIGVLGSSNHVTLEDSLLVANTASSSGGGLMVEDESMVVLERVQLEANTAVSGEFELLPRLGKDLIMKY